MYHIQASIHVLYPPSSLPSSLFSSLLIPASQVLMTTVSSSSSNNNTRSTATSRALPSNSRNHSSSLCTTQETCCTKSRCVCVCLGGCEYIRTYVWVGGWVGVSGGGLWECAWRCGCTYCAVTRVGRRHACTHMHTSGVAVQIICATIHMHVVIFTMSPQGHKTHQSPTYVPSLPPPPTHTTKGLA